MTYTPASRVPTTSPEPSAQALVAGGLAALVAQPVRARPARLVGQVHALYEVRRVLRPHDSDDPHRLAYASRSVRALATRRFGRQPHL